MKHLSCYLALSFILASVIVVHGGRMQISVGGIWPWKRYFDGSSCTNIGLALFDAPGIDASTAEAVNDGSKKCRGCILYSKSNCKGSSQNIGCGKEVTLSKALKRPHSFRCDQPCSRKCNNAQLASIG